MEKRYFLAIILSFVVLYVWSLTTVRPPVKNKEIHTQNIASKEVTTKETPLFPVLQLPAAIAENISEETITLETDKLRAKFSNIGCVLQLVEVKGYEDHLPVKNLISIPDYNNKTFELVSKDFNSIVY